MKRGRNRWSITSVLRGGCSAEVDTSEVVHRESTVKLSGNGRLGKMVWFTVGAQASHMKMGYSSIDGVGDCRGARAPYQGGIMSKMMME